MIRTKFRHPTDRVLVSLCILLIGALLAVLWYYGERINILWNANNTPVINGKPLINQQTQFYIQSAIKSIYDRTPVTDPLMNRVYFPEANFYIPLTKTSRQLVYGYYGGDSKDNPAQLTITTSALVNRLPTSFDEVPCIQRHIQVVMDSKDNPDGGLVSSVALQNGHILYIYKHQEGNCSDALWADAFSSSVILDLLKQAKSY